MASNCCVAPARMLAVVGETVTELTPDAGGFEPAATAVAERATTVGVSLVLLISERLPVMVPVESGVKATAKDFVEPASRVAGKARPVVLKPLPVTVT